MATLPESVALTPADVERASERDQRRYELINGQLVEKKVGARSLFIAGLIVERLNKQFYPRHGLAVV